MRAYKTRDPFSGDPQTVIVEKTMACSDCLKAGAELLGYSDAVPIRAEVQELQAELAAEVERHERTRERAQEAERVANESGRQARVLGRLLEEAREPSGSTRRNLFPRAGIRCLTVSLAAQLLAESDGDNSA